jgi:energy-coupling factor transporter ATP-binding protein EcfA2
MTPAIAVRGLTVTYDGATRAALDGVDLDVPPGALVVVMGATGAGKSTLARALARIVPCFTAGQVAGDVRLLGAPIDGRRVGELAGTIGMVFQDFEAQLFSTDVTQEVVFALEHTGVPPAEMPERVRRALAAVGLAGFEGRDPTTLSGGEKQRLAIAGLLALRPPIMVLDEPTTDLDPAGRTDVLRTLAALRAEGLTLVLIEHDVGAALDADALLLLREGRIAGSGEPVALLADVEACVTAGVRPWDVARVFANLGLDAPPRDVDAAAARLAAQGLRPRPPTFLPRAALTGPAAIEVRGLRHVYGTGNVALDAVDLRIRRGEFVALVGRNGSGKTTLAKHLNGLLAPTAGEVRVHGRPIDGLPLEELAQEVGYVFQDPDHQLFAASVEEEVAFGPRNVGISEAEVGRRVTEVLFAVGLEGHRDADPFLLDKGVRQRLAVAAVLALGPDVLVLDEPTTGLDFPEQQKMMALLRELNSAGRTIVIVTHTPWVIAEHADRVVLLADGRVRFDGEVRDFFADDALLAVASFRAPDVTQLGRLLGCTPLSVDELVSWMPRRSAACP